MYILGFSVCSCAFAKAKLYRVSEVLCRVLWTGHACELWILNINVPILTCPSQVTNCLSGLSGRLWPPIVLKSVGNFDD